MANKVELELLKELDYLHSIPQVALNIRKNGKLLKRKTSKEINILSKKNKDGIDIVVKTNTKNKSVHIPVLLTEGGITDVVYNDFYVGDNCDILIVAGCGIHNESNRKSQHDGIHCFHIGNNCKVKYVEKHLGVGNKQSIKNLNPTTKIILGCNSEFEMETIQLGGVNFATRKTDAVVEKDARLLITEKILTDENQIAKTHFKVELVGENSKVEVKSRAISKGRSKQEFNSNVIGNAKCFGHVECDGIICEKAQISSMPKIVAKNIDAVLIHEAAIGKISEDQQNKLMTLGLSKEQAEQEIIKGFLN